MPKITEYPKATSFDANDVLLKDGANGTKKIEIEDFIADVSDTTNGTNGKLAKAGDLETFKKMAGDQITDLTNALYNKAFTLNTSFWQRKGLASANGSVTDNTARLSTIDYLDSDIDVVSVTSDYDYAVYAWDNTDDYKGVWNGSAFVKTGITWLQNATSIKSLPGGYKHRILLKAHSGTSVTITLEECVNVSFRMPIYTDNTLTISGSPADAKTTGEKITDLTNVFHTTLNPDTFQPIIYENTYIENSNGKKMQSSTGAYCTTSVNNGYGYRAAVILDNDIYEYKINYYNAGYNLDTGGNYANLYTDYKTGLTYLSDAAPYFVITFRRVDQAMLVNADYTAILAALSCYKSTDSTLTKHGMAADALTVGAKITNLESVDRDLYKVPYTPSNISVDTNGKIYIGSGFVNSSTGNSSGISSSSSVYRKYWRTQTGTDGANTFLKIGDKALLVTLDLDWVQWTCWSYNGISNSNATHSNSRSAYIPGTEPIFIPKNSTDTRFCIGFCGLGTNDINRPTFTDEQVDAIKDAIKFYVLTDDSLSIVGSPADAKAVGDAITSIQTGIAKEATRLGLHTIPDNAGVLNAIKRARQLTDIKWTPKFDIPFRYFGSYGPDGNTFYMYGGFKAGTEYTGIPYSEHRWVGCLWPFSAFVTSLSSDKTHLATFVPGSGAADHADSTFYGVVCSVLVAYAINRPGSKSDSFLHVNGLSEIGPITENTIDDIKLGDILYKSTHVSIITDIIKDENGHVTDAEISEATSGGLENFNDLWGKYGGLCKRVMYSKSDFLSKVSTYSLCRYAYIDKVPYEYTNYSALITDGNYESIGNYPILPIQGNLVKTNSTSTRLIITMDATEDTRGHTIPTMTHAIVWRNGEVYGDPLEIQTQAQDEVVASDSASEGTVTIKAGTRYVIVTADADDEAAFSACMATMSNGSAVSWGRACRWFKYGPTKTYIPAGRTVQTSSGGFKYLNKLSDGTHEFTIRRKSTEFIPYAVSFGNITDNQGALNGYSSNVYDYTVSEVTDNNETWYEYHFKVIPPTITSPQLVPAIVSWKSAVYGVIEVSATSYQYIVGNDGKSLYYHV